MKKTLNLLLLLIVFSLSAKAQNYPVQANLNITPPYSVYLSDYASAISDKMMVNLFLKDLNQDNLQVKLRITIKGNGIEIVSKPGFLPEALYMQGGMPLQISGMDLEPYLNPENLVSSGINETEFKRSKRLPEGIYQFCVEAVEYRREVLVSNKGCTMGWLVLNDPPRWVLPQNKAILKATNPQNLFFSWMPMNTGSPNSAFTTEYEFTLVELWPENRSAEDAIQSKSPIFQTQTSETSFNYGPSEPQLIPGRKYVCRLRAYDTEGQDMFKNQGYSEILSFTFGEECKTASNIQLPDEISTEVRISWLSQMGNTEFELDYSEQNADSTWSEWYTNRTMMPFSTLEDLKTGHNYRYRLKSICESLESEYSPIASFQTPAVAPDAEEEVECGVDVSVPEIDTLSPPLESLSPGDKINVGGFEAVVVEAEGSAGTFTGKCVVKVPNFKLRVYSEFKGISINQKYQVTKGEITAVKGELKLHNIDAIIDSIGNKIDDFQEHQEEINSYPTFDSIVVILNGEEIYYSENVTFTSINQSGEEVEVQVLIDNKPPIIIVDGDTTIIAEDGIVNLDNPQDDIERQLRDSTYRVNRVDFAYYDDKDPLTMYGFDAYDAKFPQYINDYERAEVADSTYYIAWQSLESLWEGTVEMQINSRSRDSLKSRLTIESELRGQLEYNILEAKSDSVLQISLLELKGSINHEEEERITAYYKKDNGSKVEVGHLNTVTYEEQTIKVQIVNVDTEFTYTASELQSYLNQVYSASVTNFDVSISDEYLDVDYERNDLEGLDTDLPNMADYTREMRRINDAMKNHGDYDKNTFYIFLISRSEGGLLEGIMPFRSQFGYIFANTTGGSRDKQFRAIAHELGHGAFGLEHNFSERGTPQGKTPNLMDYSETKGTVLRKYQWAFIHNPKMRIFGGSESEVASFSLLLRCIDLNGDILPKVVWILGSKSGKQIGQGILFNNLKPEDEFIIWELLQTMATGSGKEANAYILVNESNDYGIMIHDIQDNFADGSWNKGLHTGKNGKTAVKTSDGTYTVEKQVHTHTTTDEGKYNYEGPSQADQDFSTKFNIPVFTIGKTEVSRALPTGAKVNGEIFKLNKNKTEYEYIGNVYKVCSIDRLKGAEYSILNN